MKKKDLFTCSKCGASLLEVGIREVAVGGYSSVDYYFTVDEYGDNKAKTKKDNVVEFQDQWIECKACGAEMYDRTASDIIKAYEGLMPHEMEDDEDDDEDDEEG